MDELTVSEKCKRTGMQNCDWCEKLDCCDNTSVEKRKLMEAQNGRC